MSATGTGSSDVRDTDAGGKTRARALGRRGTTAALLLVVAALQGGPGAASAAVRRVAVKTSEGTFVAELYPDLAPETVARFLARAGIAPAPAGAGEIAPYAGSVLCESRAHGYLVFGCAPPAGEGRAPEPPRKGSPSPDEIDARAMGLDRRTISEPRERDWLWQREIFPRYMTLREEGRPVPPGLDALVRAIREGGAAASATLDGKSRLWYLEAVGFRYREGGSPLRVERGALATANTWPGEADGRFLVALTDLPERDGRATVFGRVVGGWEALDAIQAIPVDKSHRAVRPVFVVGARESREPEAPAGAREDRRR